MAESSKALMDLEHHNPSSATLESTLLVCRNKELRDTQNSRPKPPDGKPFTIPVPQSQVLGKLKDFLGVMKESNERLQHDAKDNAKKYDIEALTGDESEYIEMDLMLGVADLHTPEAVAAAEATISGYQPVISLAEADSSSSESETDEDTDDESDDDSKPKRAKISEDDSTSQPSEKGKSKKKPNIVVLS